MRTQINRILSIALLVCTLICMMFGWIKFDLSPGALEDIGATSTEEFQYYFLIGVEIELWELKEEMADHGVHSVDVPKTMKMIEKLVDGVSPFELGAALRGLSRLFNSVRNAPNYYNDPYLYDSEGDLIISVVRVTSVIYNILLFLIVALILFTAFLHLCSRKHRGWPIFPILLVVMLLFVLTQTIFSVAINDTLYTMSERITRLTAWPFLAIACLIGSYVTWTKHIKKHGVLMGPLRLDLDGFKNDAASQMFERDYAAYQNMPGPYPQYQGAPVIDNWTCPVCSYTTGNQYAVCARCGTSRMTARPCQVCGSQLVPGNNYCTTCGSRT